MDKKQMAMGGKPFKCTMCDLFIQDNKYIKEQF